MAESVCDHLRSMAAADLEAGTSTQAQALATDMQREGDEVTVARCLEELLSQVDITAEGERKAAELSLSAKEAAKRSTYPIRVITPLGSGEAITLQVNLMTVDLKQLKEKINAGLPSGQEVHTVHRSSGIHHSAKGEMLHELMPLTQQGSLADLLGAGHTVYYSLWVKDPTALGGAGTDAVDLTTEDTDKTSVRVIEPRQFHHPTAQRTADFELMSQIFTVHLAAGGVRGDGACCDHSVIAALGASDHVATYASWDGGKMLDHALAPDHGRNPTSGDLASVAVLRGACCTFWLRKPGMKDSYTQEDYATLTQLLREPTYRENGKILRPTAWGGTQKIVPSQCKFLGVDSVVLQWPLLRDGHKYAYFTHDGKEGQLTVGEVLERFHYNCQPTCHLW